MDHGSPSTIYVSDYLSNQNIQEKESDRFCAQNFVESHVINSY